MLVAEPFKNPFRRVTLLPMNLAIAHKNLVNDGQKRIQLRRPSLLQPISGRLGVLQHLRQSLPVNSILAASRTLAQFARQYTTTNLAPKLHVGDHSGHLPHPDSPEIRQNDALPSQIQPQQLNI